jgi:hypothetical protein
LEDELQNQKPFGGHWLLEEPHGDVRGKKTPRTFSREIPCKLQVIIKKTCQTPGEF